MKLIELIAQSAEWTDDITTIYVAQPWSCDADAILVSPSPDSTEPVVQNGRRYEYFLETFLAREVIETVGGSDEAQCERLMYYAQNDA